jgi:hypothetical protein
MTPQLQQIFHSLNELTLPERWQVVEYLINQLRSVIVNIDIPDRVAPLAPLPTSPQAIFAATQGSWNHQTLDEIDNQLAVQRQLDWGE